MIAVLSPSKSMDMTPGPATETGQPAFLDRSKKLISTLRKFSTPDLMEFMAISEKLAALNRQRFKEWKAPFNTSNAKQATFAFTGDVYDGLDAPSLKKKELQFAQNHLRILSGLYGLLKPLDLIQPYRLEMGRPLKTRGATTLYAFWKETITDELNQLDGKLLINLASQEYFKAIDRKKLNKQILSPIFKDQKNGKLKVISFYAKKARGSMARFIVQNQITDAEALKAFDIDGYCYADEFSSATDLVFTRGER